MANLALSVAPGYYLEAQNASWVLGADVDFVSFTKDGPSPAISKYIAYDNLVPANPFIAVTQDGNGNVVYDGGFPKFYNSFAPPANATFSQLTASFKYLYNAINWTANPAKVAAGNKKILILGDVPAAGNYAVKSTGPDGFYTSFSHLCTILGFTPTFKDTSDYPAGELDATLAEMSDYACILVMGAVGGWVAKISDSCVTDMQTFRKNGGGLILITDDGPNLGSAAEAYPAPQVARQFFVTVNKIAVNFGAFFTGNYDRTPVNVGFLRQNYGDHPLYAGMLDSESINAGGSESKVAIAMFPKYTAANIPNVSIATNGVNSIKAIAVLKNGTIETYNFVYVIATGQLLKITDENGVEIDSFPASFASTRNFNVEVLGAGLGTIVGDVSMAGIKVADIGYTNELGSFENWYAGGSQFVPVRKGNSYLFRITSPFFYSRTFPVNRNQPNLFAVNKFSVAIARLKADGLPDTPANKMLKTALEYMNADYPHLKLPFQPDIATNLKYLRNYYRSLYDLAPQKALIYATTAEATAAMARLVPPTQASILDTWNRFGNGLYFPAGSGAAGDAGSWAWDVAKKAIVMPVSCDDWVGFTSPEEMDAYELDMVLKSDNFEDNSNAVILAFNRANGISERFALVVNMGGIPSASTPLTLKNFGSEETEWAQNSAIPRYSNTSFPTDGGWRGRSLRVKVSRRGDVFKIITSQWNSLTLDPATTIDFTLPKTGVLNQFRGPKAWGFMNISQPDSYFTLRSFKGGLLNNIVVDAQTNQTYQYANGVWSLLQGLRGPDVFSWPRVLTNPETGKSFKMNSNGTITAL